MTIPRKLCEELCQIASDNIYTGSGVLIGCEDLSVGDHVQQVDGGYLVEVRIWVSDEALEDARRSKKDSTLDGS